MLPIVFVYSGNSLPAYAMPSLELNLEHNDVPLLLLSDSPRPLWLSREVDHIGLSDFYDDPDLSSRLKGFKYPASFRNGFWIRTIERFEILSQWAKISKTQEFVHSELDNLCLGLHDALSYRSRLPDFALPRESSHQAVASLVFVGKNRKLDQVMSFFQLNSHIGNEMEMLSAFLDLQNSNAVKALPTIASLSHGSGVPWESFPIDAFGGIFDAAAVGRWLYGPDPRNSKGRATKNMQEHPRTLGRLPNSSFELVSGQLFVEDGIGNQARLYNVHVHSKIFSRLQFLPRHNRLLNRVNSGRPSQIAGPDGGYLVSEVVRWSSYIGRIAFSPRRLARRIFWTRPSPSEGFFRKLFSRFSKPAVKSWIRINK